jgi:5-methylcytosine-specific restriction protein A
MATAKSRRNIRTDESLRREAIAKQEVERLLTSRGFSVAGRRTSQGRHLIDATDPSGRKRTLWFKLGWNPDDSGTSAVQIEMIKQRAVGKRPSQLTDAEVLKEVTEKVERAVTHGATDLLLFSLDGKNKSPIACLIMPLSKVGSCFAECLKLDRRRSRKGASPTLWIKGAKAESLRLQSVVEGFSSENLLEPTPHVQSLNVDDAIEDLAPDPLVVGNQRPERRVGEVTQFVRDPAVRAKAIARAIGRCELCNQEGFLMPNGKRYLESHHIQALGEEGPDTEDNVIALCANDHRAAHYGIERATLGNRMREIVRSKLKTCETEG